MKRILSFFLAAVLLLSLFPALPTPARAAESGTWGTLNWELDDNGKLTITGQGPMLTDYNMPWPTFKVKSVVIGEGVTSIADRAFSSCMYMTDISIPESVTSIGEYAFSGCDALTELPKLPKGVTFISAYAFYACNGLTTAEIPEGVTAISNNAFQSCSSLTRVTIPETVTAIGSYAFSGCSKLVDIKLPDSLQELGSAVFQNCSSLVTMRLPDTLTTVPSFLFSGCSSLEDVQLPKGVTKIAMGAFASCTRLTRFTVPNTVTSIGAETFSGCLNLTKLTIPGTVTQIGIHCFDNTPLKTAGPIGGGYDLEFGWTAYIPGNTFNGMESLTKLVIPGSIQAISNEQCFLCKNLETVILGDGVTTIGSNAFSTTSKLKTVVIPASVQKIGIYGFFTLLDLDVDVYYGGSEASWKRITVGLGNDELLEANIHYAQISTGTDSSSSDKTATGMVTQKEEKPKETAIQLYAMDGSGNFFSALGDLVTGSNNGTFTASGTFGSNLIPKGGLRIPAKDAVSQNIVISREGYQDYIIPKSVSDSFRSTAEREHHSTWFHTAYVNKRSGDAPYISTVFARVSGSGGVYQEVIHSTMNLEAGKGTDLIISVAGMEGKEISYGLYQNPLHMVTSKTGVFANADLFGKFDYDKPIYAVAMASDGTTTAPQKLRLRKQVEEPPLLKELKQNTTLNFIGPDGQSIEIPEDFPLVGGAQISLDGLNAPIGISVTGNSVKISLGLDIFKGEKGMDEDWEFTNFKKNLKESFGTGSLKDGKDELDIYRTFIDKFSDKYSGYYDFNRNFNIAALGYIEAEITDGRLVFKEILLNVAGQFTFKYTQQGAIWVIPAYYYVEVGAKLGLTGKFARPHANPQVPMDFGLILDIEPELKLGGGAGVHGAVSGGVYGKGSLPYSNDFSELYHTLKLSGDLGIEGEFFILSGDLSLLNGELVLVDGYYLGGGSKNTVSQTASMNASMSIRAETSEDSQWLGDSEEISLLAAEATGTTFRTLNTGVSSQTQPRIAEVGGKLVMVWAEDNSKRDTYNRMRLVYSVYNSSTNRWSNAQPVWDDGFNDGYPVLCSDGTNLYVAWQKICTTLTETTCTPSNLLCASEVCFAKWDASSQSFTDCQRLTNNNRYEYALSIGTENGAPAVYYAAADTDKLSASGATTLYRQQPGSEATVAAEKCNYILTSDALGGAVSYVMDTDGNLNTTADIGVYTLSDGKTTRFGSAGETYTAAVYGQLGSKDTLFVSDGYNIYYMENGTKKAVFDTSRNVSPDFSLLNTSQGTTILWTESEEGWNELYTVTYQNGSWTKPVRVSQQEQLLTWVDAAVLNDTVMGVCNATKRTKNSSGVYTSGTTNLRSFTLTRFTDTGLVDALYFDESTLQPGKEHSFDVVVKNNGSTRVDTMTFKVEDTLGTSHSFSRTVDLASGEMAIVTLTYPVPASYGPTTLTVTGTCEGDSGSDNNKLTLTVGKADLSVTEFANQQFAEGYQISAAVENLSAVTASGITVSVVLNQKNGTVLYTDVVDSLTRNEIYTGQFIIPANRLVFDENNVAKVYITATSANGDAADADNICCILLTRNTEDGCLHSNVQTIYIQEPTCTEAGHTAWWKCADCGEALTGAQEIPALKHCYANGICLRCGETDQQQSPDGVLRISGDTRFDTAIAAAEAMRKTLGIQKFDSVIIAYGNNFPDALAGSYLSTVKKAPILMASYDSGSHRKGTEKTVAYVRQNLKAGGTVYLLGGTAVLSEQVAQQFKDYQVKRLAGATRFQTNIEILKEAGFSGGEILVCTGYNFADSLSASATGKPILLVKAEWKQLSKDYTDYLKSLGGELRFTIVGGNNAVNPALEASLASYGKVLTRLAGATRYETSVMVAQRYFDSPVSAVLAYAKNYPDGLCGGPLAYLKGAPLILTDAGHEKAAAGYLTAGKISSGFVLGGKSVLPDQTIRKVFSLAADTPIEAYK